MSAEPEEHVDGAHAARHLSDLAAAKPGPVPVPEPLRPRWVRRLRSPRVRLPTAAIMTVGGTYEVAEGHSWFWVYVALGSWTAWDVYRSWR